LQGEVERLSEEVNSLQQSLAEAQQQCADAEAAKVKAVEDAEAAIIAMEMKSEAELSNGSQLQEVVDLVSSELRQAQAQLQEVTSERDALQRAKTELEAKSEALTDKVKRLKMLLTKSKEQMDLMKQQQAEEQANGARKDKERSEIVVPEAFLIVARVAVAPSGSGRNDNDGAIWCCLQDCTDSSGGTGSTSLFSWVPEGQLRQLLGNGGVEKKYEVRNAWPTHTLQEIFAQELRRTQDSYTDQIRQLSAELEETNKSFKEYKVRAQSALKRIGTDERTQKQQVVAAESAVIEGLNETVADLTKKVAGLEDANQQLQYKLVLRENAVEDMNTSLQELEAKYQEKVDECIDLCAELSECRESLRLFADCEAKVARTEAAELNCSSSNGFANETHRDKQPAAGNSQLHIRTSSPEEDGDQERHVPDVNNKKVPAKEEGSAGAVGSAGDKLSRNSVLYHQVRFARPFLPLIVQSFNVFHSSCIGG
jgi:chromosome segregation ATPase